MMLWSYIVRRIFIERDKIDPVLYPPAPHVIFAASPDHMPIVTHTCVVVKYFLRFFCALGLLFFAKAGNSGMMQHVQFVHTFYD